MKKTPKAAIERRISPRLRVTCGNEVALGPGKAELLGAVAETGSIVKAAARMNMSYMRAWTLIRIMNRCFKEPLVESTRGGKGGGGARLTEPGREVLNLYCRMEQKCTVATNQDWILLKNLLRR